MLVLGAGPGGYSAAFGFCPSGYGDGFSGTLPNPWWRRLNVGCIPSKALLHTAAVVEVKVMTAHGIAFAPPQID